MGKQLTEMRRFNAGASFGSAGKRHFHNITMSEFAKFIGGVLQAPVADQTGLTGTYDIEMTPPRIGGEEGKLQRVTVILHNELGLRLISFLGPFSQEEKQAAGDTPVHMRLPDGLPPQSEVRSQNADGTFLVALPDGTKTNVAMTLVADGQGAPGQGFAIELDHSDAPGLKPSTGEAEALAAGVFEVDTPGVPPGIANNLRLIASSKQQWALEQRKQNTETPTWEDLRPYLARGPNGDMSDFTSPNGGSYAIRNVGEKPQFRTNPTASASFEQVLTPIDPIVTKQNACINNLRLIDAAKQQWALEFRKQTTDTPAKEDLQPYLGRGVHGEWPVCPDGGVYSIKSVGEPPTCSIAGHALQ
jgi:hypothetical protein